MEYALKLFVKAYVEICRCRGTYLYLHDDLISNYNYEIQIITEIEIPKSYILVDSSGTLFSPLIFVKILLGIKFSENISADSDIQIDVIFKSC
jgi:hypothetical protein